MEKNFEKLELAIGNIMENNDHPSFPKINSGLLNLDSPVISTSKQSLGPLLVEAVFHTK